MIRFRLLIVVLVAVAVTAGGLFLERSVGPARTTAASAPEAVSGAWLCPHGGAEGWASWVVLANPSDRTADVVTTTVSGGTGGTSRRIELAPETQAFVELDAEAPGSSTFVEYFGAPVGAAMGLSRPKGAGLGTEPCAPAGAPRWYDVDATTVEGQGAQLVVMNPFATPAVIDVTLNGDGRSLKPGRLQGVIIAGGKTKAFDLNRYLLDAESLSATVVASPGQVAVAGVGTGSPGARLTLAAPAPSTEWLFPGAADGGVSRLTVFGVEDGTSFAARAQGPDEQVPSIEDETVTKGEIAAFDVPTAVGGLVVTAAGDVPFVASRRMEAGDDKEVPELGVEVGTEEEEPEEGQGSRKDRRRNQGEREEPPGDTAGTAGAVRAKSSWLALPAAGPSGGSAFLVVQNPGDQDLRVGLRAFGDSGPLPAPGETSVPAGRVVVIDLDEVADGAPVSVLVDAGDGKVAAAQIAMADEGYALATAIPLVAY